VFIIGTQPIILSSVIDFVTFQRKDLNLFTYINKIFNAPFKENDLNLFTYINKIFNATCEVKFF
jgi:hypothetical protein